MFSRPELENFVRLLTAEEQFHINSVSGVPCRDSAARYMQPPCAHVCCPLPDAAAATVVVRVCFCSCHALVAIVAINRRCWLCAQIETKFGERRRTLELQLAKLRLSLPHGRCRPRAKDLLSFHPTSVAHLCLLPLIFMAFCFVLSSFLFGSPNSVTGSAGEDTKQGLPLERTQSHSTLMFSGLLLAACCLQVAACLVCGVWCVVFWYSVLAACCLLLAACCLLLAACLVCGVCGVVCSILVLST